MLTKMIMDMTLNKTVSRPHSTYPPINFQACDSSYSRWHAGMGVSACLYKKKIILLAPVQGMLAYC